MVRVFSVLLVALAACQAVPEIAFTNEAPVDADGGAINPPPRAPEGDASVPKGSFADAAPDVPAVSSDDASDDGAALPDGPACMPKGGICKKGKDGDKECCSGKCDPNGTCGGP